MKVITDFFIRIRDSFFSPTEYVAVRTKSLGGLLGFFFLVALITATLVIVPLSVSVFKSANFSGADTLVADHYPQGLEITIKDGVASTNVPQPYFIAIPEKDRTDSKIFENYLVIDTRSELTLDELAGYNSAVVLTEKQLFVQGEDEQRSIPLSTFGNFSVTEAETEKWYSVILGFMKGLLIPLMILFIPIMAGLALAGHAVASLLGALIVKLVGMLRKTKLLYGEAYKIALFASVPILIFETLSYLAGFPFVPFWLTLLLFVTIVFVSMPQNTASEGGPLS